MCDMGNPGKDFPCEVAPNRLSRGYAESKPFDKVNTRWESIETIQKQRRTDIEVWGKIADILVEAGVKDFNGVTDLIFEVFKEGI